MKTKILYALALSTLLITSCQNSDKKKAKQNKKVNLKEVVKVLPLDYQSVTQTIDYTGNVLPFEEVNIVPSTPAKIEKIYVEVSDHVSKGDLLVEMDKTQWQQAKVQLSTLEADMQRFEELKKTNSIAPQKYDQMKAQYEVMKNNLAFLQKNTLLKAPFSGVISAKYYEEGEMFSGAPNPMTGKSSIVTLLQIDKLKIVVAVSEKYYPLIKKGTLAEVKSEIFPNNKFRAKVFNIYPTIDPVTRTFNVELSLENKKELLRPGMFVKTEITISQVKTILLPDHAVLKMQGSNDRYLFVNDKGKAKRIAVSIGKRYDSNIEVMSTELKRGDQVIVKGQSRLLDGDELEIVE